MAMPYTIRDWLTSLPAVPLGEEAPAKGTEVHEAGPFHSDVEAWTQARRILREMPEYKVESWRDDHRIADDAEIRRLCGIK